MFQVGDIVQVIIVPKKYKQYDITGATGIVKTVYSNNIRIHISSYYNEKSEEGDFYFKENELDNFARKENDMSIIELWEKRSIEKIDVELWKPCAHATIGHMYRELANFYYKKTCDDILRPEMACSDFGMRGMSCMEEAERCSVA